MEGLYERLERERPLAWIIPAAFFKGKYGKMLAENPEQWQREVAKARAKREEENTGL